MERELRQEKREPIKEPKGGEEPKEVKEMREKLLDKLSRRRVEHVVKMYRMLPPEEREKIKAEVSDKFKEEFLDILKLNDREAELWYEKLKEDEVAGLMSRGKWEKWKKLWENEIKAAEEANAQMTKEELELRNLSGKERWRVWFGRFGLDELRKWKEIMEVIIKPMEEGGITKGPEMDIWEALKLEEAKKYEDRAGVPFLIEEQGRLEELGLIEKEEIFPGIKRRNEYKRVFTEKKLGKEGREEGVGYLKQRQRRYKDVEEEIERERSEY